MIIIYLDFVYVEWNKCKIYVFYIYFNIKKKYFNNIYKI